MARNENATIPPELLEESELWARLATSPEWEFFWNHPLVGGALESEKRRMLSQPMTEIEFNRSQARIMAFETLRNLNTPEEYEAALRELREQ